MSLKSKAKDAILEKLCNAIEAAAENGYFQLDLKDQDDNYNSEFDSMIKEYFEEEEDFKIDNWGIASW